MIVTLYQKLDPLIKIQINNVEIFKGQLTNRLTEFNIDYKKFTLKIELLDKSHRDTVVENNKIVKDKFLKIHNIKFDNLILNEEDFLINYDPYLHHNNNKIKSNFLGFNSPSYVECEIVHPYNQLIKPLIENGSLATYDYHGCSSAG